MGRFVPELVPFLVSFFSVRFPSNRHSENVLSEDSKLFVLSILSDVAYSCRDSSTHIPLFFSAFDQLWRQSLEMGDRASQLQLVRFLSLLVSLQGASRSMNASLQEGSQIMDSSSQGGSFSMDASFQGVSLTTGAPFQNISHTMDASSFLGVVKFVLTDSEKDLFLEDSLESDDAIAIAHLYPSCTRHVFHPRE